MPTLCFEGETHGEILRRVRRWLQSVEGQEEHLSAAEAVEAASELTKDALTIIAQAAPEPVARNEVVKSLTRMGYDVTDATKRAVIGSLDALADATEGDWIKRARHARNQVVYEMNSAVAKQLLRILKPSG